MGSGCYKSYEDGSLVSKNKTNQTKRKSKKPKESKKVPALGHGCMPSAHLILKLDLFHHSPPGASFVAKRPF